MKPRDLALAEPLLQGASCGAQPLRVSLLAGVSLVVLLHLMPWGAQQPSHQETVATVAWRQPVSARRFPQTVRAPGLLQPTMIWQALQPAKARRFTHRAAAVSSGDLSTAAETKVVSRRHAGLAAALAGTAGLMMPKAAVADDEFANGPTGIKYRDIVVGEAVKRNYRGYGEKGSGVIGGDTVKVNYVLKLASTGEKVDEKKSFSFIASTAEVLNGVNVALVGDAGESMPRMKVGGKRQVIIPPFLGYGKRRTVKSALGTTIPPNSDLDLTIEVLSVTPDARMDKPADYGPM
eukprot:gnl/TRDRNA2_/TRDRNA2_137453_c0_seq1.p1 gnl/TRDRNA2_/TRDRNA2_137453_c0~~gnl/TRDRNA2_/TRDRNA2_137453_c0_seq1.p1  ORF type:complete len:292 (-),score=42.48 gnl/TRDRNA2_/TRDRNA2_137453_c0_seq1:45-920(-)